MAKKKTAKKAETKEAPEKDVAPKKEEEKKEEAPKKSEASVYDARNEFVRTYSKKVHGDDYKKLAEGFARKINGKIS